MFDIALDCVRNRRLASMRLSRIHKSVTKSRAQHSGVTNEWEFQKSALCSKSVGAQKSSLEEKSSQRALSRSIHNHCQATTEKMSTNGYHRALWQVKNIKFSWANENVDKFLKQKTREKTERICNSILIVSDDIIFDGLCAHCPHCSITKNESKQR